MSVTAELRPLMSAPTRLSALADLLEQGLSPAAAAVGVTGVTLDSRGVQAGDLYAALPGARVHGAEFSAAAVTGGARAVLTDPAGVAGAAVAGVPVLVAADPRAVLGPIAARIYGNPADQMTTLGVTGTNGKTTVAYLLEAGLRAAGRRTGLIGTVETRIGTRVVPSVRTTPEAPQLQALLAVMVEAGVDAVALEVSSHALALHRVDGMGFSVGAFTNLSQDHLDFHGDLPAYFAAKALLFDGRSAKAVVNIDDPYGARLVTPSTVTVSTGGNRTAHWWTEAVHTVPGGGSRFTVHGPAGLLLDTRIALPGLFNVANAVLAIAVLHAAGVEPALAAAGLAETSVPGRMEAVDAGQPFTVIVDYAHTPAAVATLLSALRPATVGTLIVVLGCGGDRDAGKRPMMGRAAALGADLVVVTDDNPRSEPPAAIRAEMAAGARAVPGATVLEIGDRREAIAEGLRRARPGDTVVVAGKGHEQGQEIDGTVLAFDDRVVVRELLGTPA